MRRIRVVAGLTVALAMIGLLVYGVGWQQVLENVRRANPIAFAGAVFAGVAILVLRGWLLKRLLEPVEGAAHGVPFAGAFLGGYFARSVLPWGRSTGTPITAYFLAGKSHSRFEDNLAVVTVAEAFGFLASVVVALVGFGLYVYGTGGTTTQGAITGLGIAVVVAVLVTGTLVSAATGGIVRSVLLAAVDRFETATKHRSRVPGGDGSLGRRVRSFFATLESVSADRRTVVAAFGIALASWFVNALPLYLALVALGVNAPLSLALVCAPIAALGGVVPLPGGTGSIEVLLTGLLVAATTATGDVATAAALLYRVSTYWVHVALGGVGAVYLSITGVRTVRSE